MLLAALESGKALAEIRMNDEQKAVDSRFPAVLRKDPGGDRQHRRRRAASRALYAAYDRGRARAGRARRVGSGTLENVARRREEFEKEMGLVGTDRDHLIRTLLKYSGQMTFFTAGEKEVRTWLIRQGGTALEAADGIHTDLARGFIRAEVMSVGDLLRLGSEREIKAQHLMRQEHKDYVIKEDDIVFIRFSV